jgi:triphosphoribosyl-dephospho-CoA synthetase
MQTLGAHVISDHIRELRRDADSARLARLARTAAASRRGPATWRRVGGAAARQLSAGLESVALRLDPSVCRPSYGRE